MCDDNGLVQADDVSVFFGDLCQRRYLLYLLILHLVHVLVVEVVPEFFLVVV